MVRDKLRWTLLLYLRSVMYFYGNIVGDYGYYGIFCKGKREIV